MQTLVIGDIHSCYIELQALLEKAGLNDGDSILAIGDIIDRGPETPQVLEFFQQAPNARVLMGNREHKHVRAGRHESSSPSRNKSAANSWENRMEIR